MKKKILSLVILVFGVFVILSMKPYIDQSRDIIRQLYDRLEKDKMTDNVGFAVVAFRSSTTATPGLEYTSAVVSDFATAKDRAALESRLAAVQQASALPVMRAAWRGSLSSASMQARMWSIWRKNASMKSSHCASSSPSSSRKTQTLSPERRLYKGWRFRSSLWRCGERGGRDGVGIVG